MGWRLPIACLLVLALGAIALVLTQESGSAATYTPNDVMAAFASEGIPVRAVDASSVGTLVLGNNGTMLVPPNGRFTVLLANSDAIAMKWFEPYKTMKSPDTFELLEGNVVVESDASNSDTPLPEAVRAKIRRVAARLRELHRSP